MPPHDFLAITKGTTNVFRVPITFGVGGSVVDLSAYSNFWFQAKRRHTDSDELAVFTKVYFDGIEVIDAPNGVIEVTVLPEDTAALDEGIRENLVAAVGGQDGDLNKFEFLTLLLIAYPRVRRSNA
jgi:hypothetical protein